MEQLKNEEKIKKMFWEDLPKKGKITNWKQSIGYKVKFIYEDIEGEVEIIDYYRKSNGDLYLDIKYNDEILSIYVSAFKKCKIGEVLGKINHEYKYKVGDIYENTRHEKLEILEQIKIKNGKYTKKGYKYKCLTCGYKNISSEYHFNRGDGCPFCNNKKFKKGVNDMWTTNAKLAKLLANPEDGYKYMQNSTKKINWKCPNCGNIIKNKSVDNINRAGLSCPKCSDGVSYPEKIIYNILQQLNIDFITQLNKKIFSWCEKYRYDFCFEYNKEYYIIETHGLQHYQESGRGRTLEEEQENDKSKKKSALQNGIKEENYIILDCRKSELEWIRDNENGILNSKLAKIFDLRKIDWCKTEGFTCSSLIKQACEYWNNGIKDTLEISKILKLGRNTVTKYLKQGSNVGFCNYDVEKIKEDTILRNHNSQKRQVICVNDNKFFNSIDEAKDYYNLKSNNISGCCKGKAKSCGKHPITGEPLKWIYYDDYLQKSYEI